MDGGDRRCYAERASRDPAAVATAERRYKYVSHLSDEERSVWRGFLLTYASCVRQLDDELRLAHGMSLNALEVLWLLLIEPGHRLRMAELADRLVFTRSGITRLVERLERDGLVDRSLVEHDARGVYAELTDRGYEAFKQAARTHAEGVRRVFFDKLDDADLEYLQKLWSRFEPASCREREAWIRSATRRDGRGGAQA